MIKKLLFSLAIIATVSTTSFMATKALLTSTVTITANAESTGTVSLKISKTGSTFTSSPVSGFSDTVRPGHSSTNFFFLKNLETDNVMSLAGQATNTGSSTLSTDLVTITVTPVDSSNVQILGTTPVTGTLTQWIAGIPFATPADDLAANTAQKYKLTVTMDPTITTNGTANFDLNFTGTLQ